MWTLKTVLVALFHFIRNLWIWPRTRSNCKSAIKNAPFWPYENHSRNSKTLKHKDRRKKKRKHFPWQRIETFCHTCTQLNWFWKERDVVLVIFKLCCAWCVWVDSSIAFTYFREIDFGFFSHLCIVTRQLVGLKLQGYK